MLEFLGLSTAATGSAVLQQSKSVNAGGLEGAAKASVINNAISTVGSVVTSIFGKNATTTKSNVFGSSVTTSGTGTAQGSTFGEWVSNNTTTVIVAVIVIVLLFGKSIMRMFRRR